MTTFRLQSPVRAIDGNLLFTDTDVWAAWRIPVTSYRMLGDLDKRARLNDLLGALAAIREGDVHLRVVPRRFDSDAWADQITARHPDPHDGFAWYRDSQKRILASRGDWYREVTLYVRLGERTQTDLASRFLRTLRRGTGLDSPVLEEDEVASWQAQARRLGTELEGRNVKPHPLTAHDLILQLDHTTWRALDVNHQPPLERVRYGPGTLKALTPGEYVEHPRHLEQVYPGPALLRWLAVDTVPDDLVFPGGEWLTLAGLLFPIEVSLRFTLTPAGRLTRKAQRLQERAQEQWEDAHATRRATPAGLEDARRGLREIEAQTTRDRLPVVEGLRAIFCVWASDPQTLDERTALLRGHFRDLGMEVHAPADDQLLLHASAQPGGRVYSTLGLRAPYEHWMPLSTLAGAMPHADNELGDRRGFLIGWNSDGQPVHFDPLTPAQVTDGPTGIEITGMPGQGKSTLGGILMAGAAYQGRSGLIVDPSNRLGALQQLPGMKGIRVLRLGPEDAGCLDPFSLGRDGDDLAAPADLAANVAQMLVRPLIASEAEEVIQRAAQDEASGDRPSMLGMIAKLRAWGGNPAARQVADALEVASRSLVGRLFFATPHSHPLEVQEGLTVLQVQGLDVPDASLSRDEWTSGDRQASTAMYLIAQYARLILTKLPRHVEKVIFLDEVHAIACTPWGVRMVAQGVRDGRKHNGAVILASQTSMDFGGNLVEANIGARFAFHTRHDQEVDAVLTAHGLELTERNRQRIVGLPKGACLFTDDHRSGVLYVDRLLREVAQVLDTTAPQAVRA